MEGDTTAKVDALKALDKEITALTEERKGVLELEEGRKRALAVTESLTKPAEAMKFPGKADPKAEKKSLGELFIESKAFQEKGKSATLDIDLKTIMSETTGAGWGAEALRIPRVELEAQRQLVVADVFPQIATNMNSIKYMFESTYTSNAAEVAESVTLQTYGEAALALTEKSETIEKIAVWLPVTDEQLEDVVGIMDYINGRMKYMIMARLDSQLVTGDGNTPNLRGVLNAANGTSIQTQDLGSDSRPDAVFKAITLVRTVGFAEPNVILMNPADWQQIRLLTTADGIYIFGSPMEAGTPRLWGLPVVVTTAETSGTAVVGDFKAYSALYTKRGLEFAITDSHSTYFIGGVQAIRCTMRVAAVYFRGLAFCKVTSI